MRRRLRRTLGLLLVATAGLAAADTIVLTNGDVISGVITETTDETVTIEAEIGTLEIKRSDIRRIEYTDDAGDSEPIRDGAFILRPLPLILGALIGVTDIVFEGQSAFTEQFALTAIGEIALIGPIFGTSLVVGPQWRPFGGYLEGFFVGVYPGFMLFTDGLSSLTVFAAKAEIGWQWVFDSGFLLAASTGGTYVGAGTLFSGTVFNISAHFGFAFPDPLLGALRRG